MPETLEDKLQKIERAYDPIKELFKNSIEVGGDMHPSDFVVLGAAKRTLALADGFCGHIRKRNFTCAGALMRLQLDTALRIYAATLFDDKEQYAQAILNGERIDRLKDRDNQRLTDNYLAKKLSEHHSWVSAVYENLCDFVHLSRRHINTSIAKLDEATRTVHYQISAEDPPRPEESYFEIVNGFHHTMRLTIQLAQAWQLGKRQQREPQAQDATSK